MNILNPKNITQFQTKILTWFEKNKRDLPWRHTRDPYKILVSEVMLQQTQVSRVLPKYSVWLKTFPTLSSLAKAKTSEVLKLWSGLGYNRRALYLQKTAKIITEKYNGVFPQDEKLLRTFPGIGEYTARAVLCFAFDKQVAVVDTNVRKVILTQFQMPNEKQIQKIADQILPQKHAFDWNQALMDYAAAMLKKEKIPIPKQSKFAGSDRYYRGQIIHILLEKRKITKQKLARMLKKEGDDAWLEIILLGLVKDGFIQISKNIITLVS